jgi:hypothetical protein
MVDEFRRSSPATAVTRIHSCAEKVAMWKAEIDRCGVTFWRIQKSEEIGLGLRFASRSLFFARAARRAGGTAGGGAPLAGDFLDYFFASGFGMSANSIGTVS